MGISTRAIRYYEELKLIIPKRSNGGFREYSDSEVDKLVTILKLKKLGLSLEEIRKLVGIRNCVKKPESSAELLKNLHARLHEFEEKITDYKNGIKEVKKVIEFLENCTECSDDAKLFKCDQCINNSNKKVPEMMKALF